MKQTRAGLLAITEAATPSSGMRMATRGRSKHVAHWLNIPEVGGGGPAGAGDAALRGRPRCPRHLDEARVQERSQRKQRGGGIAPQGLAMRVEALMRSRCPGGLW